MKFRFTSGSSFLLVENEVKPYTEAYVSVREYLDVLDAGLGAVVYYFTKVVTAHSKGSGTFATTSEDLRSC